MSDHRYRIGSDFLFKESDKPYQRVLRFLLIAAVTAFVLAVVLYLVFSVAVNTDVEGRLKRENKMFEKLYPQLLPGQELLDDAISNLELKDGAIYRDVFNSSAPSVDPINTLTALNDTVLNTKLIAYASDKSDRMYEDMFKIENSFREALYKVASDNALIPPMFLPLKDISFTQLGASVGLKTNPVLKARVPHKGLDIIVPSGTPVYSSGEGTVTEVVKSNKGSGNTVTISHAGGYVTKYAHLSTMSVKRGQKVKARQKIGTVGMSGSSFAPHLHYEVSYMGQTVDPVNFIFASVSADEYANMFYMAANTEQSMD